MAIIKGYLFVGLVLVSAIFGLHVLTIPIIFLYWFTSLRLLSSYLSKIQSNWMALIADFFLMCGVKIVVSGDIQQGKFNNTGTDSRHRSLVIILNHRTRLDWLFLFGLWDHLASLENLRIILKSSLKHVPIYGTTLQMLGHIFINRKWSQDKDYLTDCLRFYTDTKFPLQLVLFPEGTDFSKSNRKRDKEYAIQNDLSLYECVLHPRTTGFVQTIQALGGTSQVDVCDLTIGYIGNIPQGEKEIANGLFPDKIHFHIKHHPSSSLPSSDEELGEWLKKTWDQKDELLTKFYQNKSFPGPAIEEIQRSKVVRVTVLVKWLLLCTIVVYSCIKVPLLMISVLGIPLIIHFVIDKWFGGWDNITLKRWKASKLPN